MKVNNAEKIDDIVARRKAGETLESIGRRHGICRERVRQICKTFGACKPVKERPPARPKVPRYSAEKGNLLAVEAKAYAAERGLRDPVVAYNSHKNDARVRSIAFDLTFDQWWGYWKEHYHLRGQKGLHMARYLDLGGYSVGNVAIESGKKNRSDQRLSRAIKKHHKKRASVPYLADEQNGVRQLNYELSSFGGDPLQILLDREDAAVR